MEAMEELVYAESELRGFNTGHPSFRTELEIKGDRLTDGLGQRRGDSGLNHRPGDRQALREA